MARYNGFNTLDQRYALDDPRNGITLRSDLHSEFDAKRIVIVPKRGYLMDAEEGPTSEPLHGSDHLLVIRYMVQCLDPQINLLDSYHNRCTLGLDGIRPEFLYARLAWAIFPLLAFFFSEDCPRYVARIKEGSRNDIEHVELSPQELQEHMAPISATGSTRSKRIRMTAGSSNGDQCDRHSSEPSFVILLDHATPPVLGQTIHRPPQSRGNRSRHQPPG